MSTGTEIIKEWELKQDQGGFLSYKESMEWVANKIDNTIKEIPPRIKIVGCSPATEIWDHKDYSWPDMNSEGD